MEILIEFLIEVVFEGIFELIGLGIRKAVGERSYQVIKGVACGILSFIFVGFLVFMITICLNEKNNFLLWGCTVLFGAFLILLLYKILKKEYGKEK